MLRNLHANAGDMGLIPGLGRFHMPQSNSAGELQLLKPVYPEPVLCSKRSHHNEEPAHRNEEWPLFAATRESLHKSNKDSATKNKLISKVFWFFF